MLTIFGSARRISHVAQNFNHQLQNSEIPRNYRVGMTQSAHTPALPLRLRYVPSAELACIRVRGPYAMSTSAAWQRLFDWLTRRGHDQKKGCGYGLAHDDPASVDPADLRYDACVVLPDTWQPVDGRIAWRQKFRGGPYAVRRIVGPYAELSEAINEVRTIWIPRADWRIDKDRPLVTIYHDNPVTTQPKLQTADVAVPIDIAVETTAPHAA